jgi:putative membrane protein
VYFNNLSTKMQANLSTLAWSPIQIAFKREAAKKVNDIPDRTRRDPADFLAIGRTIMANERTLLAFLRTSLAFFLVGGGLIKFLNHPVLDAIGWIFILLGGIFLTWGEQRYRQVRKVLREVTPQDQQSAEKEMGL